MHPLLSSVFDVWAGKGWLIAANVVLTGLVALWMVRYRGLYLRTLAEQENNADLVENLSEGIYRALLDGRHIKSNRALARLNGYASEEEMLAGILDSDKPWYVEPGRRDEFRAILMRDGKVEDFVSEIYRHKTRERIWITESARLVHDRKTGRKLYYEGSVREITETIKRLKLEEQFQKLTSRLPSGLFQFRNFSDGRSEMLYVSAGIEQISGISPEEHLADPWAFTNLVFDEDREAYLTSQYEAAAKLESWNCEVRIRARDGKEKWVSMDARPEKSADCVTWHGYVADISVRKQHEMEIEELAYFDPLTKLPNRRMFLNRMAQAIDACERRGDTGALLFIDLDNFKTLNDTQGHDVGDSFLVQVAGRLRRCINPRDMVARIGGDEFVVVLEETGSDSAHGTLRAITTTNQILAAMNRPFELGPLRHVGSASVGVVVFDGAEKRPDEILKRADIAMYQAKAAGRNSMALFDPATMDREAQRYRMLNDLRTAFAENQLDLYFQPQVDHNGRVTGAEALVRWDHPTLGRIFPDQFVALAEQFGLNDELAEFVFSRGLQALAGWQCDPVMAHLRLALNVSVQSFSSDDFITMVNRKIKTYGVDPAMLTFELTEHVMAKDHQLVASRMAEAKKLGVRLSLDDFGTGYSSLAYLKQLPFDELKIDGGFVADIEGSDSDRALVKTILAMARTLDLTAVAEHVENVRQEAFLRAFGCDFFQGYLYSPAVPADQFAEMFHALPVHPAVPAPSMLQQA
jgi:diguanylate cyclase (GGDEF)-like protein/PAS domain S-box-containing protein